MQLSQCNDLRPGNLNLDTIVSVEFFLEITTVIILWSGFTKLLQKWMLKPCDLFFYLFIFDVIVIIVMVVIIWYNEIYCVLDDF